MSSLSASALVAGGVTLHRAETVRALLDLDEVDLAALVSSAFLLEVSLGAGLTRFVFADAVPSTLAGSGVR